MLDHNLEALGFLQAFEESADWALHGFIFFVMIQTCIHLHSSNLTPKVNLALLHI